MDYLTSFDRLCSPPFEMHPNCLPRSHKRPPVDGVEEFYAPVDVGDLDCTADSADNQPVNLEVTSQFVPSSVPRSGAPPNLSFESHNEAFPVRHYPDGDFAVIPGGEIQPATWAHYPRTEPHKTSVEHTPYESNIKHSSMNAFHPYSYPLSSSVASPPTWSPSEHALGASSMSRSAFEATPGAGTPVPNTVPSVDGFPSSYGVVPSSISYHHHSPEHFVVQQSPHSHPPNDLMVPQQHNLAQQPNLHTVRSYSQLPHDHRGYSVGAANVGVHGRASQGQLLHSSGPDGTQQNLGFVPTVSVPQGGRKSGYEETMLWMMMNSRSPDFIRNNAQAFASLPSVQNVPAGPPSLTTTSSGSKDSTSGSSGSPSPSIHSYSSAGSVRTDVRGIQSLNPSLTVNPEAIRAAEIRADSIPASELSTILETRPSIPAASLRTKRSSSGGLRQSRTRSSMSPDSPPGSSIGTGITATSLAVAAAMRSTPATTGRPSLACLFCRRRKIACPPPSPKSEDLTCQQCLARNLICEYPTHTRRGLPKHRPAKQFTLEDIRSMARGFRDESTTAITRPHERMQSQGSFTGAEAEPEGSLEDSAPEDNSRDDFYGPAGIRKSQRQSTMPRRLLHDFPDYEEDE